MQNSINQFCAGRQFLAGILAAVLHQQLYRRFEAFDACLARFVLPIGLGES